MQLARLVDRISNALESKTFSIFTRVARRSHAAALVTLRIAVAENDEGVRHLHVDGRLTGDEVGELEQLIGDDPSAVCLELENLRSADSAGLGALRRLRAEGVEMRGVPPHLAWRIEEEGS